VPITKWQDKLIQKAALDVAEQRMKLATVVVQGEVKKLLNVGGPEPSEPGEPPHKQSGRLYGSIHTTVERTADSVSGAVYSDDKKAARLELGFVGKDSAGRTIDQKPRPFMRPGFKNAMDKVKKILGGR
jgi:hypothetical protein